MEIAALVISVSALLFTIASFWWMNWRKGRIFVSLPNTYAAVANEDLVHVQLPLVYYNDGATTRMIQNQRIRLEQDGNRSPYLQFNNTLPHEASNEGREWASPFAIEGRKAYSSVFVFQRKHGAFTFWAGEWAVTLEGRLDKDREWRTLLTFDLYTPERALETLNGNKLLAYDNTPDEEWGG